MDQKEHDDGRELLYIGNAVECVLGLAQKLGNCSDSQLTRKYRERLLQFSPRQLDEYVQLRANAICAGTFKPNYFNEFYNA